MSNKTPIQLDKNTNSPLDELVKPCYNGTAPYTHNIDRINPLNT